MNAYPEGTWHRLHPLSPLVRIGRRITGLVVLLAIPVLTSGRGGHPQDEITDLVILGLAAVAGVVSWLVTRWRIQDGVLRIDTGLLRRQTTQVPLSRIQSVDVVRPAMARICGLAEVRVRTGGGHNGDARLAYLPGERAEEVQARLLELARMSGGRPPGTAETPLASMRTWRLLAGIGLQGGTLTTLVVVVGLLLLLRFGPSWVSGPSLLGAVAAVILGGGAATLRRVTSQIGYEVADAGDGLRVRGGLITTVVETIPRHRIQALRLTQPLLWRQFGWARLQVDVAGAEHRQGEERSSGGQLRTLLPVAPLGECQRLLVELLPGVGSRPATAPPPQARLKAPLSYHFLRAGLAPGHAQASWGRLCRETAWVPLAKVQSMRWQQGPLQRRMGLASVNLDVAGNRLGVALRDRSQAEARALAERVPGLCREARLAARVTKAEVPPTPSPDV